MRTKARKYDLPNGKTLQELMEERAPGLYGEIYDKIVSEINAQVSVLEHRINFYPQDDKKKIVWIRYYDVNDCIVFQSRKEFINKIHENKVFMQFSLQNRQSIMDAVDNAIASYKVIGGRGKTTKHFVRKSAPATLISADEMDRKKVASARQILLLLSEGIDPMTFDRITLETMSRLEVKEALKFVAELLGQVDFDNATLQDSNNELCDVRQEPENLTRIVKEDIVISEKPISFSGFLTRVNKAVAIGTKKLQSKDIYSFLEREGYLKKEEVQVVKVVSEMRITEKSGEIGIINEEKADLKTGEVTGKVMLSKEAQQFIVANIEKINDQIEIAPIDTMTPERDRREQEQLRENRLSRAGQKWDANEEQLLIEEFEKGYTIAELANMHDRKPGGIRSRLKILGLIE